MDYFQELERKLKARIGSLPPEKIVFVGVGNRSRGDDAAGPLIIDMLAKHVPNAIDAAQTPEDVTGEVRRVMPKAVVFIDALFMRDLPPGTPVIAEIDDILRYRETAHAFSLDVVMEYLKKETRADVFMIGIQPKDIAYGEGFSPEMEPAIRRIAEAILLAINKE